MQKIGCVVYVQPLLIIIQSNDSKLILIESTKFYDLYCPEVPESCSDYKWEPVPSEIGRWQRSKVAKHGEVEAHVRLLCYRDNITKNVHSIIFWPFGLYGRYEGLKTYKQVLNRISVQEITIPNIKMYLGWC